MFSKCVHDDKTNKDQPSHARTNKVYRYFSKEKEKDITTRADQVNLAQLCSGHHKSLKAYANRLDDEVDPTCPDCGEEPQDLKHWFEICKGVQITTLKQQMFGGETVKDVGLLTKCPKESVTLARRSILGWIGALKTDTHTHYSIKSWINHFE